LASLGQEDGKTSTQYLIFEDFFYQKTATLFFAEKLKNA
jgi:hypothetical protein